MYLIFIYTIYQHIVIASSSKRIKFWVILTNHILSNQSHRNILNQSDFDFFVPNQPIT
jgi:hypothetical protein